MNSIRFAWTAWILALVLILPAQAAHDQASLASEIAQANQAGSGSIALSQDIVLSEPLPSIRGDIRIDGNGHSISGDQQFRIFVVDGGELALSNMTLREGHAPEGKDGGAILLRNGASLSVERVTFSDNAAFQGGAIATTSDVPRLSIAQSSFVENSAEEFGGALYLQARQSDITRSSFQRNRSGWYAGAIAAHEGKLNLSNSTFFNNVADVAGALEIFVGDVTLTHVTVLNKLGSSHGSEIHRTGGNIRLRNSIVMSLGAQNNCANGMTELSGNISADGTCSLLEKKLNPLLGEFAGMPGWIPLLDGSPALDAANPDYCLEIDQLGNPRPHGGGCDSGAIESTTAKPAPSPILPPPGCALADAITAANTDAPAGACFAGSGHDIITLDKNHNLRASLPPITSEITIEGNGHNISGAIKYRIFDVAGGKLTLRNVTLRQGNGVDGGAVRLRENATLVAENVSFTRNLATNGAAIATLSNSSRATIRNSIFDGNRAESWGGAIRVQRGAVAITGSHFTKNQAQAFGGAINSEYGSLEVSNSSLTRNKAAAGGAVHVDFGRATLTHLTMLDNEADQLNGDAIYSYEAKIVLRNSIIDSSSEVADDCDGLASTSSHNINPDGSCGAKPSDDPRLGKLTGSPGYYPLLDGSPAVDAADPQFCSDVDQIGTPRPQGGGCDIGAIESLTAIPAQPAPAPAVCTLYDQIISFNTDRPVGHCPAGRGADTISLSHDIRLDARLPEITSGLTIEGNGHSISGDGRFPIFSVHNTWLKIKNLTLRDGYRPRRYGGAIATRGETSVVIENSHFIDNIALAGGAIGLTDSNSSRMDISGSSFSGNRAEQDGGAILMRTGTLSISGSSFAGNRAGSGGAIAVMSGVEVIISNSSFSGNQANTRGGVLLVHYPGVSMTHVTMLNNQGSGYREGEALWIGGNNSGFRLRNSVIAGGGNRAADCFGRLTQNIGNLIKDGSCAPKLTGDPLLGELTGSPGYHFPQAGSPLIGAGDARFCQETDQRGATRSQFGGCDIGAVEAPPIITDIANCQVTTTHGLNFRQSPGGQRIGIVPRGASFAAHSRTHGWFKIEHNGATGWISADYVTTEGACD